MLVSDIIPVFQPLFLNDYQKQIMVFKLSDDGTIQFPVHFRYLDLAMSLTLNRFNLKCQEYTILVPSDDCLVSFQHFILLKLLDSMCYS